MRLAWLTDIHLNFLAHEESDRFIQRLYNTDADAIVISGDISEAPDVEEYLERMARVLPMPIYFVLGNHDFYFGSIRRGRAAIARLSARLPNLVYLTAAQLPIELQADTGLIGHDGWADARYGDYERSLVMMNDYKLIEELAGADKRGRLPLLRGLADEAADHIRKVLPAALAKYKHVVLATHLPPLRDACWHDGDISDNEWIPHFTCKAIGDAILELMRTHRDRRLTVLCGHTHSPGYCQPLQNVEIFTGGARYGSPDIQQIFEL